MGDKFCIYYREGDRKIGRIGGEMIRLTPKRKGQICLSVYGFIDKAILCAVCLFRTCCGWGRVFCEKQCEKRVLE